MSKFRGKTKGTSKTVGAGWRGESKSGTKFISVKINGEKLKQDPSGDVTLFGYVNGYKEKDTDPDYVFYEPQEGARKPTRAADDDADEAPRKARNTAPAKTSEDTEDDEEVPF